MTEPQLNEKVQQLIKKAEALQPNGIEIQYHDEKSGFVRHDQAQHFLRNGKLVIDVLDQTDVNYIVSHELLHFMLMFEKLPQIAFNLESGRQKLDTKYTATGMELYDILMQHDGILMGYSAGAVIQLAEYHLSPDDDYPEFKYYEGLPYLNDFYMEVHYEGTAVQDESIQRVLAERGKTVFATAVRSGAILVDNGNLKLLGDVKVFGK